MKELYKAVDIEIREDAREEAKEILRLTTDEYRQEFLKYHKTDRGTICCLVLDTAKIKLIEEGKIKSYSSKDHFGQSLFDGCYPKE